MDLYTKNGKPLQVSGSTVYSRSGRVVGRIKGEKVYGTDGRYVGSIVGDRLVYRSTHSAGISSPFSSANRTGTARARRAGSAIWGTEPDIPD
ncbi:4-fold beta flower protein [Pseudomonas mediterranea]|uniref:4-fold beta flower protein n=1 Tax=Pseudomonas mediterranea TaxID=183795 RepID=UPI0009E98C44